MWKKNPLGGYEQGTTKSGSVKEKNPIRSGWYRHPQTKQVIWYDSKTNTFRDKTAGPAREALSVGWKLSRGKFVEDLTRRSVSGAKKIIPALWKYDKARRKELGEVMDTSFDYYKKSLTNLLVSDVDPGFIDPKDTTGQSTEVVTPKTDTSKESVVKPERSSFYFTDKYEKDNDVPPQVKKEIDQGKAELQKLFGVQL